jgi:hypothetical protein
MGIYDRDYVFRRSPSSRRLSFNAWIIIVNCVVFFGGFMLGGLALPVYMDAQVSDPNYDGRAVKPVGPYLTSDGARAPKELLRTPGRVVARELVYAHNGQPVRGLATYRTDYPLHALGHFSTYLAVFKLEVWRLVTFQFLHANVTHLLFNMIGLYMFGGMVEQYLGSKRYLAFYLACGICGGLGYLLLNLAARQPGDHPAGGPLGRSVRGHPRVRVYLSQLHRAAHLPAHSDEAPHDGLCLRGHRRGRGPVQLAERGR